MSIAVISAWGCDAESAKPARASAKAAVKPVSTSTDTTHVTKTAADTATPVEKLPRLETDASLAARCQSGNEGACIDAAERARRSAKSTTSELEHAMVVLQSACDRKLADGCAGLGSMYQDGAFVARDLARATQLYRAACESGSGRGCSRLGALYARGVGVERDPGRALEYSKLGCQRSDALGCVNLGLMEQHADGVPRDSKAAREHYQQACALDDGAGCRLLGALYADGAAGEPPNPKLAAMFSERACLQGDATGCGNAGMNAQVGYGVAQDTKLAARLYKQACDLGEQRFCELLQRFAASAAEHEQAR